MHLLEFKNISKKYGSFEALKNISFSIPENSIFGILGANGSGKSTFMKILPGLIQNWTGQIFYKDKILKLNSKLLKNNFGYLIESPTFYEYLTAKQNLELFSRISFVSNDRINTVLKLVNLIERKNDKVSNYSYGMKQRLGIAQALLHDPDIIVLDEPNNGLDPNGINDMTKLIKELKSQGKTICLSTHNLKDVEEICTDFTIFKNGINSISTSMEIQLKNSKKWLLNVNDKNEAIARITKSNLFNVLNVYNNNILVDSKSNSTIKDLNNILYDLELYKINKDSDLISYFKND